LDNFSKFFNSKLKHPFSSNRKKKGTPVFQKLVFSVSEKGAFRFLIQSRKTDVSFFHLF